MVSDSGPAGGFDSVLKSLFRDDAASIADDGFTTDVVARVHKRRRRRLVVLAAASTLGMLITLLIALPAINGVAPVVSQWLSEQGAWAALGEWGSSWTTIAAITLLAVPAIFQWIGD